MAGRILNAHALATTDARRAALTIVEEALDAIDVDTVLRRSVVRTPHSLTIAGRSYDLDNRRVYFVGVGKCAVRAAGAIESILGDALTGGIALDLVDGQSLTRIDSYVGTHPLPSEANVAGTRAIIDLLSECHERDLVIMLISGGGSTLLSLPDSPMTVVEEAALFHMLTERGAPIHAMNTVRKHLSRARGGGLAAAAYPAQVVALVVSDVPGDDLLTIASAPTMLDNTTIADAEQVLRTYNVTPQQATTFIETPKDPLRFSHAETVLLIKSGDALEAMKVSAQKAGYTPSIVERHYAGEARELGRSIATHLRTAPAMTACLYAGESTVTLTTDAGMGGRNQELALAALDHMDEHSLILPFASDGRDNTDHAGAIADKVTSEHARTQTLNTAEYLDAHRSYDFFITTGDALVTGYTGSNVSDLIIALRT